MGMRRGRILDPLWLEKLEKAEELRKQGLSWAQIGERMAPESTNPENYIKVCVHNWKKRRTQMQETAATLGVAPSSEEAKKDPEEENKHLEQNKPGADPDLT